MKQMHTISNPDYNLLISQIGQAYTAAQNAAKHAIVTEQLKANWYIGCYIVEYEQKGNIRAAYGKHLLVDLAKDLTLRYERALVELILCICAYFIFVIRKKKLWLHNYRGLIILIS